VLDHGRIIERGTHRALTQSAGLYQRMLEVQDEVFALG
jgi:ABC-type multidrug transport system fused ATPase/permease subunit